jgi:hypothetical protein
MTWLIALALGFGMILLLVHDYRRKQNRTEEEYQADVEKAGGSLIGAAGLELQKLFQADLEKAVHYQQDEKGGMTEADHEGDDVERKGETGR